MGAGSGGRPRERCSCLGVRRLPPQRIVAVAYPRNLASLNVIARLDVALEGVQFCYGATLAKYRLPIDDWRAAARGPRSDAAPARRERPPSARVYNL